jgi:hypothetical protein
VLPPGHTALALTAKQVSTRWLTLQWKNDSTAVSRAYVLLRNGKDTVFANTTAITSDTITVKDSSLTPSTTYNYTLYRIYQNQHWDSATTQVHTLDTTKDNYNFNITKIPGAVLYGVWGLNPNSVWAVGGSLLVHYLNGQISLDTLFGNSFYSITGTSDTNIWIGNAGAVNHWNGKTLAIYVFNGDSLPNVQQNFTGIWIAPDSEIFCVCDGGSIVHRSVSGKWETMATPTTLALTSIVGFSPSNIYACGGYSNYQGILLHYDGTAWSEDSAAKASNIYSTIGNIYSVYGDSPDSLFVVGNAIMHRKGTAWDDRTPPQQQYYAESVHSQGWNDVFVSGFYGMLLHFDGDHWVSYNNIPINSQTAIINVFNIGGEVFGVGSTNGQAYFLHGQ